MTPPILVQPLCSPFDAYLPMPGSKSHANRAIILACLCEGQTTLLENATPCDDVVLLVGNLQTMGYAVRWVDKQSGMLEMKGGLPQVRNKGPIELHCENAGTTMRFLTSLACITPGEWILTGSERMKKRPIGDLVTALRTIGAQIEDTDDCPPLRIRGRSLLGGRTTLNAAKSSQYLTSLLLIASSLQEGLTIDLPSGMASASYVDLTQKVLKDFGVEIARNASGVQVRRQRSTSPQRYTIEGDWSAAGAFLVLAEITKSTIAFPNLSVDSTQGDAQLPSIIRKMRGKGTITIACEQFPDQVMNLAVLAGYRQGETRFTGAANLRIKECDRLAVITQELKKAGAAIQELPDGLIIRGPSRLKSTTFDPHGDHRMAMAFAILGATHPEMPISDPGCVSKSYPRFFEDLASLHASARCIAIVGMRGSGKSNLGRKLAKTLKLKHVDADKEFERLHGKIPAFVAQKGWHTFRAEEETIIEGLIVAGRVLSLGGGAVESPGVRDLLMRYCTVVWIQADTLTLIKRLKAGKRPALTDLPLEKEVPMILKKRSPWYRHVATITLPASVRLSRQIPFVLSALQKQCSW